MNGCLSRCLNGDPTGRKSPQTLKETSELPGQEHRFPALTRTTMFAEPGPIDGAPHCPSLPRSRRAASSGRSPSHVRAASVRAQPRDAPGWAQLFLGAGGGCEGGPSGNDTGKLWTAGLEEKANFITREINKF